jgi:hypothetical protein
MSEHHHLSFGADWPRSRHEGARQSMGCREHQGGIAGLFELPSRTCRALGADVSSALELLAGEDLVGLLRLANTFDQALLSG